MSTPLTTAARPHDASHPLSNTSPSPPSSSLHLFQPLPPLSPHSSPSSPRLGLLLSRVPTPHFLTPTTHGLPTHLTVDNWRHVPGCTAFHLSLSSFLTCPSASSLSSYLSYPASTPLLLSLLDPSTPAVGPSNDASYTLPTVRGNVRVSPSTFVQRGLALSPTALLLMADDLPPPAAGEMARGGREKKSVWRTLRWLKEQLIAVHGRQAEGEGAGEEGKEPSSKRQRTEERGSEREEMQPALDSATLTRAEGGEGRPYLVATVPPCGDADTRALFLQQLLAHAHLLDGYNVPWTPSPTAAAPYAPLSSVVSSLPPWALRVSASYHPPNLSCLLSLIAGGIDLVSTTVPHHHTTHGLALSLTSPALSLLSPSHATSDLPLTPSCPCYTCAHHSRAYVHHLLVVKEMLAFVLLDLHNLTVIAQLFRQAREALADGDGSRWQEWLTNTMARFVENERVGTADGQTVQSTASV